MKTIHKQLFVLIPIITFALTITIANSITRTIEHRRAVTSDRSQPAGELLSGSYSNAISTFNSSCAR